MVDVDRSAWADVAITTSVRLRPMDVRPGDRVATTRQRSARRRRPSRPGSRSSSPCIGLPRSCPSCYRRLADALPALVEQFEIILVDDGGGDGSWAVIEDLAARDDRVRGIRMSRNYGQHNAMLCGIRAAGTTSS